MTTNPVATRALIDARHLKKRYASRTVVHDVDLTVVPGEIVGVIGPNGAGKSTTLEMVLGLRQPDGGSVQYWTPDPRRELGVQLQHTPFFPGLSAAENLRVFAAFYNVTLSRETERAILERCGLLEHAGTAASRLSGGQQKRLAIAVAVAHQPHVVFLDEPTAALDPRARHAIRELIGAIASGGAAVVFTSHDMEEVERLADRVVMIVDGRVLAAGTPAELLAHFEAPDLDALYLQLTERP